MSEKHSARTERLLKWLQDAYAMEQEAGTMMKAMASRIQNYPQLAARVAQHARETQQQADSLRECIHSLGGSVPTAKGLFASLTAAMHAAGNSLMEDEVIKGIGLSFGFENTEIATYRALVVAAERAGAPTSPRSARRSCRKRSPWRAGWRTTRTVWSAHSSIANKPPAPNPSADPAPPAIASPGGSSCSFTTRN